eukprot:CAMPEP_0201488952 /NCGR_PEP_ID=MMETSP0151_2-20130828/20672_1 /ASSEMBLY_ACC=CAM_ASM_000257 /TAXON_ID=200890 /ORGANISM="Paramoeba atlantica, Strain 621/1 / CCAP 1560/9" /LENGTH=314 /DNA_ID=CAMNT_0047874397 /DNA_START=80 /DNA_END=1021 /DNA_ORIENTATION=+
MFRLILFFAFCLSVFSQYEYPVPIPPGGRNAVHGWLILPFANQTIDPNDPSKPIRGWFFHHVSEFPEESPHNFHIMVLGQIFSLPHVSNNLTAPLAFPIPPVIPTEGVEWTFTPPPPFSLNDLLGGRITELQGVIYNGSFDTLYERFPTNLARLEIEALTTAVWLNSSDAVTQYQDIHYFSYPFIENQPGLEFDSSIFDMYLAHELHAPITDYDQILHVTIDVDYCKCTCLQDNCTCPDARSPYSVWFDAISTGGQRWIAPGVPNDVGLPQSMNPVQVVAETDAGQEITCSTMKVLEQMHCMVGPLFGVHCPFS